MMGYGWGMGYRLAPECESRKTHLVYGKRKRKLLFFPYLINKFLCQIICFYKEECV